jgi:hypothetical protein
VVNRKMKKNAVFVFKVRSYFNATKIIKVSQIVVKE